MKTITRLLPLTLTAFGWIQPSLAGQWDYPMAGEPASNAEQAKHYLETHYGQVGQLTLSDQTRSRLGQQYHFRLHHKGEYLHQRTLVLHTDHHGQITRIFKSLTDTTLQQGEPTIAAEVDYPRRLQAEYPPTLSTGDVVMASVGVVDPDLRSMQKLPAPESPWMSLDEYPNVTHPVLRDVAVMRADDHLYLSNSRVQQVDVHALEEQHPETGEWSRSRLSDGFYPSEGITRFNPIDRLQEADFASADFLQLMAFYHLDRSLQHLESLGYDLFDQPILFDGRGLLNNNSAYYPGPQLVLLGVDTSPDALDADVIVHELAHAIHYRIVKDWAYGHSGALGEGFADYWAGSYSYRQLHKEGSDFEIDTVFNWDGHFGQGLGTRSLANHDARYVPHADYRAHASVAGALGDELWSTPLFQTLKRGVEYFGDIAFREMDTLVVESLFGLGRGVKMHDWAEQLVVVANQLYPDRPYAEWLSERFQHHGLVLAPIRMEWSSRYIEANAPATVRFFSDERPITMTGRLNSGTDTNTVAFAEQGISEWQSAIPLPNARTLNAKDCGQPLPVTTQIDYHYAPHLRMQHWENTATAVLGTPQLNQSIPTVQSILPDARSSRLGALNIGFKSFSFLVNADDQVINNDLGIYLHLRHPEFSDLKIVLISPQGTRLTLAQSELFSQSERTLWWTGQFDAIARQLNGEKFEGTWRLEVSDYGEGDQGELVAWAVGRVTGFDCGLAERADTEVTGGSARPAHTIAQPSSGGGAITWGMLIFLAALSGIKNVSSRLRKNTG